LVPAAGEHSEIQYDKVGARGALRAAHLYRREHAMRLLRRQFLHLTAGAAALPAMSRIAKAQAYPSRPVRIIVGFAAGGFSDIVARLMGQWLSERLGQPFVIENRVGAASNIAAELVTRAPADGYTVLVFNVSAAINATLYEKLNFNFMRDIAPVAAIARVPGVMVVHPSVPVRTVPEFITYAKANPGNLSMASGGSGSSQHIYGELFKMMSGTNLVHVPYRGGAPAMADALGGQVQVVFASVPEAIEYIKAGRLRPLAVTTMTRVEALPDIPTLSDFMPGYDASSWQGMGAPKNTPAELIAKLNAQINDALGDPKIRERLADLGGIALPGTPADFGRLIAGETEKWAKVVKFSGAKAD
jgi:tripartite-type tricarboxylate transporter receptor subunit TctC